MGGAVRAVVYPYPDMKSLSRGAAEILVAQANATVARRGRFSLVLSGGKTPLLLYRLLAGEYANRIPWLRLHIYWGDERYVPPDDPRSNFGTAREALLDHVPIPPENIHPIPTDLPQPEDAARAYEATLRTQFPGVWPTFDLMLLGLGADGHTASLFPGSPALKEPERWAVAVQAPAAPPERLTVTMPVINHARQVYFLVSGIEKTKALRCALTDTPDIATCPASAARSLNGAVFWLVEEALLLPHNPWPDR